MAIAKTRDLKTACSHMMPLPTHLSDIANRFRIGVAMTNKRDNERTDK